MLQPSAAFPTTTHRLGILLFHSTTVCLLPKLRVMKALLGVLVVLLCLFAGCIAIPPLITVQHSESGSSSADKKRIEELEKRVRELEQQLQRR